MIELSKEILLRGHKVMYCTLELETNLFLLRHLLPHSNFSYINLGGENVIELIDNLIEIEKQGVDPILNLLDIWHTFSKLEEQMLPDLLHTFNQTKPDIIISDFITFAGFSAADHFNIPVINNLVGVFITPRTPLFVPPISSGFSLSEMSEISIRFQSLLHNIIGQFLWKYAEYLSNQVRIANGVRELVFHPFDRITIVNSFIGMDYSQPVIGSNLIHFVGDVRARNWNNNNINDENNNEYEHEEELEDEVMKWINRCKNNNDDDRNCHVEDERAIIYVSMGTITIQREIILKKMFEVFERMKEFRFIWSIRERVQKLYPHLFDREIPSNIKIVKWANQVKLLKNSKVKLFFSHGGFNSISESIHFGKPILCFPHFGDQHENCHRIKELGFSETLFVNEVDSSLDSSSSIVLEDYLKKMIYNQTYELNAKKIKRVAAYSSRYGSRTAIDIVEQVAYFGEDFFIPPQTYFTTIQYYNLDIIFVFVFIPILSFIFLIYKRY